MRTPLMTTLSAGCDLTHKRVAPCRLTGHREISSDADYSRSDSSSQFGASAATANNVCTHEVICPRRTMVKVTPSTADNATS